ncbi:MAG: TonB-dependent receptor plug domain-containing protein, partial [Pseudohongiellaceae bacterium]
LGEMLQSQVGVNNASFGVGVGLPVIRGQSANRVQILQGGVGNVDASAVSPDHANSLEPALAERIEVVRGPATLLYGNGAIGGVVNVIDNSIPDTMPDGFTALLETRNNSVSDQQTSVMKLEGGAGAFAWHLDAIDRSSNDTRINGYAINPALVDLDDAEAVEQLLESRGHLGNSDVDAESWTVGGSWLLEGGYVGMAYSKLNNGYGLPAGAHEHHDEEDHEDEQGEEHEEEHEGDIRIVMEQERWDLEGEAALSGFFTEMHGKLSVVDYQHAEVEGDGSIGTVFRNDGMEGRLLFHLGQIADREGVLGVQFGNREFSAVGEEAFIPATDISSLAL